MNYMKRKIFVCLRVEGLFDGINHMTIDEKLRIKSCLAWNIIADNTSLS